MEFDEFQDDIDYDALEQNAKQQQQKRGSK
jgi:hypothetical protein